MKMHTSPADRIFSKLVRARARWRCERCLTQYQEGARGLECAHIIGRRNKAVRWHPLNAVALCTACHFHFTANPLEFADWVNQDMDIAILRERARPILKLSKADKAEILVNLKHEWKTMVPGKDFQSPYKCDEAEPTNLGRREKVARAA